MSQKIFRHTPHRGADAIKILAGTKTNATIRDLEETIEDIEEKEGVVTVIDKDKINGNGWTVKDKEGSVYVCNCASSMYELPETEEYSGLYYPTDTVSVKFTVNPVLGTNTITEIISLGKNEEKIDLSKWKHGDKATKIIASPKSAISISDAVISFNYDNDNKVTADENEIGIDGKKTNIHSTTLDINSENINIGNQSLDDYIRDKSKDIDLNRQKDSNIDLTQQGNIGQLNLNFGNQKIDIPGTNVQSDQRILKDLIDPSLFPEEAQRQPLLAEMDIHSLYIYPNGLVTVQANQQSNVSKKIFSTHQWVIPKNVGKNLLTVSVAQPCGCCSSGSLNGTQIYFNYCPSCKTWNTLYDQYNVITCSSCHQKWCQGCGHLKSEECSNKTKDLKKYNDWKISAISMPCEYCENEIDYGKTREYANYCPSCQHWGYLTVNDEVIDGKERRFLYCTHCKEYYCVNCSISQRKGFIKNFFEDQTNYSYNNFIQNYFKMIHIRDD